MRNWRTWSRRPSYSCLHCALNCAAVGFGWPLAGLGAVLVLLATHSVKSGGCGTFTAVFFAPGRAPCEEMAATCIQWLNCVWLIDSPPPLARESLATESPQAKRATAGTAMAPTASKRRRFRIIRVECSNGRLLRGRTLSRTRATDQSDLGWSPGHL